MCSRWGCRASSAVRTGSCSSSTATHSCCRCVRMLPAHVVLSSSFRMPSCQVTHHPATPWCSLPLAVVYSWVLLCVTGLTLKQCICHPIGFLGRVLVGNARLSVWVLSSAIAGARCCRPHWELRHSLRSLPLQKIRQDVKKASSPTRKGSLLLHPDQLMHPQ